MGKRGLKYIDFIVIIIEFGYCLSILGDIVNTRYNFGIATFMILGYLLRFKRMPDLSKFVLTSRLFVVFFIICFFDILQFVVVDIGLGVGRAMLTFNFLVFVQYLNDVWKELPDDKKDSILKPYVVYGVYNVVTVFLAMVLIVTGVLSATSNPVSYSIMQDNIANESNYYFPGYLSIVIDTTRVLSNIPILTGLSHEPHVLCFLVMPVAFLALGRIKTFIGRFIIYVAIFILLIVSMSTTAITVFIIVLLVELFWSFGRVKKISNFILIAIVGVLAYLYYFDVLSDTQLFIMKKIDTDTGSLVYSENILRYVVTPTSIIGSGNTGMGDFFEGADSQIGYITSFLDVLFYIILCVKTVRLVISRDNDTHYIGIACLYFSLHLLKVSFLVFNYPYLIFIMYIIERYSRSEKNVITITLPRNNYFINTH